MILLTFLNAYVKMKIGKGGDLMPLLVLLILCTVAALIVIDILYVHWKRLMLIFKLKRACRKNGYRARFRRSPFTSVMLFKGRLDLTVESEGRKFAIIILTSRYKTGKYVFYGDRMEIWKRKSLMLHRVSAGRNGYAVHGRSMELYSGMVYKGRIKLHTNKIIEKYPLHEGICLINPAVNTVCISYGTNHTEIHDGDRIHSGFKVYGLSGFLRQLNDESEWFGI